LVATPDRNLLERAQSGDALAFEELVRPHVTSVRRLAYAFVQRWSDADDLAQEALIKAFCAIGSFEGRSAFSTWLYTVTRRVCQDFQRGRGAGGRRREDVFDEEEPPPSQGNSLEPIDELLVSKAEVERLWEHLRQLAPEFRVALVLFEIEGMAYEEIAKIERIPVGTVRSRLARARQQLRARLTAASAESSRRLGTSSELGPSESGSPT
jgi:RNA polymerase sigma-70 factor (ECF subfamily)